jgi:hypothetical protein
VIKLADGTTQPFTTLQVRATEDTAGPRSVPEVHTLNAYDKTDATTVESGGVSLGEHHRRAGRARSELEAHRLPGGGLQRRPLPAPRFSPQR